MTERARRVAGSTGVVGAVTTAAALVWAATTLPSWASPAPAAAPPPAPVQVRNPTLERQLAVARRELAAARRELSAVNQRINRLGAAPSPARPSTVTSVPRPSAHRQPTRTSPHVTPRSAPRTTTKKPSSPPPTHTTTKASGAP